MSTVLLQPCVTVVIGVRVPSSSPERARNLGACLAALSRQELERPYYQIVVVEQDSARRLEPDAAIDHYVFAYNPGVFNRSWGRNIGAKVARAGVLCFLDADILVPCDFLMRGEAAWSAGTVAIRPFSEVFYLDAASTRRAIHSVSEGNLDFNDPELTGFVPARTDGCLWVDFGLHVKMNGHDERFEGWGYEDNEFFLRLSAATSVKALSGRLLHMHHPRDDFIRREERANRMLFAALKAGLIPPQRGPTGDIARYRRA